MLINAIAQRRATTPVVFREHSGFWVEPSSAAPGRSRESMDHAQRALRIKGCSLAWGHREGIQEHGLKLA